VTSPTRRDAVENRTALLSAARVVLNRDPDASLEAIAAHAGLSRRSVYGHFATREHLLREVMELGAARLTEALRSTTATDPVVELALIAARLWTEVEEIRVMAVFAVRGPLASHITTALAPLRAMVLSAVERGQREELVRTDIAAPRLARLAEDSMLAVFEESTREPLASAEGRRLTMLAILATLGLDWRAATTLIDSTTELQ
jgi:AcrR family transcriptional regulator